MKTTKKQLPKMKRTMTKKLKTPNYGPSLKMRNVVVAADDDGDCVDYYDCCDDDNDVVPVAAVIGVVFFVGDYYCDDDVGVNCVVGDFVRYSVADVVAGDLLLRLDFVVDLNDVVSIDGYDVLSNSLKRNVVDDITKRTRTRTKTTKMRTLLRKQRPLLNL